MKPKNRLWVIADLHFNHEKILRYTKRPYKNIGEMHRDLIEKWNGIIGDDDTVVVIGDFCFANKSNQVFNFTKRLRGNKILVRGNHDRLTISSYYSAGFNFVCDSFTLKHCGKKMLFVHDPRTVAKGDYQKYDIILYGHTHNKPFSKDNGRFVNVCVEQINGTPILLNSVLSMTAKSNIRRENKKIEKDLELEFRDGVPTEEDELLIEESRKSLDKFRNRGR